MIKQAILYTILIFTILLVQFVVLYFLSKEKNKPPFKENLISFIGASLFIGIMFSLISTIFDSINYKIILFIIMASIISSYWFIINPLKYLFKAKKYCRDNKLEDELKTEGYNYKILFTDQFVSNALATGIIPFYKIIIVGNNLKEKLTKAELKSIIYHEIGHHKRKHILKLFFVNIILQTIFFVMFSEILKLHNTVVFVEGLLVALVGGIGGLLFWFIPNKVSFYFEYYADEYSANHYDRSAMIDSLTKLDEITGGKFTKGNSNHPSLEKRINNIKK
ncbi:M48 family metallopeptidase [Marinifilum sp. RC60d5]|uniref:M48 family metallopeptidase n=1 Tax=Marinifilum sp. RC60d5 TaxID=3458414 RepID=UPI004035D672